MGMKEGLGAEAEAAACLIGLWATGSRQPGLLCLPPHPGSLGLRPTSTGRRGPSGPTAGTGRSVSMDVGVRGVTHRLLAGMSPELGFLPGKGGKVDAQRSRGGQGPCCLHLGEIEEDQPEPSLHHKCSQPVLLASTCSIFGQSLKGTVQKTMTQLTPILLVLRESRELFNKSKLANYVNSKQVEPQSECKGSNCPQSWGSSLLSAPAAPSERPNATRGGAGSFGRR